MRLRSLVVLGLLAVSCGLGDPAPHSTVPASSAPPAGTAAASGLGSTTDVVANFAGARFLGHASQLADGRTRWIGHRSSDHASVEIVGDPVVTEISVTVIAGPRGGRLVAQVLGTYAPGSTPLFLEVMESDGTDVDRERAFGDRVVRVHRASGGDQALVTVTVRSQA